MYMYQSQSANSPHLSLCPLGIPTFVLYVCISISALYIGSSIEVDIYLKDLVTMIIAIVLNVCGSTQ